MYNKEKFTIKEEHTAGGCYWYFYTTPYNGKMIFIATEDMVDYVRDGLKRNFEIPYLRRHEKQIDYTEQSVGKTYKNCTEIRINIPPEQAEPFISFLQNFMKQQGGNFPEISLN
jgi:hypothetical protein